MQLIFCADPLAPNAPDSLYEVEVAAAERHGISYSLIQFERLVNDGNAVAATRRVRATDAPECAVYRGWMLRPQHYALLYNALRAKGLELINTPAAYQHCHYLPESYAVIEQVTPRSVWLPIDEYTPEHVATLLEPFNSQPLIVKDYVKSRKHEWFEACFIPAANDRANVGRVVAAFVERQGAELNGGLVFRQYVDFAPIGTHTRSGMPLTSEFRCFVLDGTIIATSAYWEQGSYTTHAPPSDLFAGVISHVRSRFFTMDVAQRTDDTWMIVELGDGQVAGLPETLDIAAFYETLAQRLA